VSEERQREEAVNQKKKPKREEKVVKLF